MFCIKLPFNHNMDIFRWRFILIGISLQAVLCFSSFGKVLAQDVYFSQRVLQLAKDTTCNCVRDCTPGDMEPETMCFAACDCSAKPAVKRKAIPSCDVYGDCICPNSLDITCPLNSIQVCTFEDGVICEYEKQYCVDHTESKRPVCECKDGWTGPNCEVCLNCDNGATSEAANNLTAMILGSLLVIVVLALLCLIIVYWKLGRLPCQVDKPKPNKKQTDPTKSAMGNAYSVSGPIPITGADGEAGKPDADTGERENEYTYAAINEYATIGAREKSMRPAVPTAPVPSVAATKTSETGPFYFQLAEGGAPNTIADTTPTTSTTTKSAAADCYTQVIRKPKEEKPKPPISQYDRLDRSNVRPPTNGGDSESPSDNMYGTLLSTMQSEENIDLK